VFLLEIWTVKIVCVVMGRDCCWCWQELPAPINCDLYLIKI